jgi:hypothetical protein
VKTASRRTGEESQLHDELKAFNGEETMAFVRLCGHQCDRNTALRVFLVATKTSSAAPLKQHPLIVGIVKKYVVIVRLSTLVHEEPIDRKSVV